MTTGHAWRRCAAAGVATFLCAWGFGRIPGLIACGPTHGVGPVLTFEFVQSPAGVAALFGVEPCRSVFAAAQKYGLLLDALGFIPAYTAFLILAAIAGTGKHPIRKHIIAAIAIAGLCDQVEGALLYRILSDLPGDQALIDALWWPVHVKFALLAAGTLGIAVLLLANRRIGGIVAAGPIGLGALTAMAGLIDSPSPVMTTGFAIAWITLLLCALAGSGRASLFSARAGPPPAPAPPTA